jgi:hypothetical protein
VDNPFSASERRAAERAMRNLDPDLCQQVLDDCLWRIAAHDIHRPRLPAGDAGAGQTGRVQSASAQAKIALILCAAHKAGVPAINQTSFIGEINFL